MIMLMLLDVADMYLAPTLSAVSQLTNMRPRVAGGGRVFREGLGEWVVWGPSRPIFMVMFLPNSSSGCQGGIYFLYWKLCT